MRRISALRLGTIHQNDSRHGDRKGRPMPRAVALIKNNHRNYNAKKGDQISDLTEVHRARNSHQQKKQGKRDG